MSKPPNDIANQVAAQIPTFLGDTAGPKSDQIIANIAGVRYGAHAEDIGYGHKTYNDMTHMALATDMNVFQDFLAAMGLPQ